MSTHYLLHAGSADGPHTLTVTCACTMKNGTRRKGIYVILRDEDGLELVKMFPLTQSGPSAEYMEFTKACRLTHMESRSFDWEILIGRKGEAEVFESENGLPDARGWARVGGES